MEDKFTLEIISPEKSVFSGEVEMVKLPSYEGDMSIQKNHISIIAFLRPGIIKVKKNEGAIEDFFIQEGTLEFFKNNLAVLSSSVKNIKDLSKDFIDQLSEETKKKLSEKNITDNERYILHHKLDALKEIRV